ncbi:PIG-L deacetylase family protein [Amycolatopsis sp. NPDC051071]|uniref:PIG-L deacetylase family protein n=1 Tax=Amycolatopsis sp. NPDC051071 TaxID=3154637 RepID=UPI0034393E33
MPEPTPQLKVLPEDWETAIAIVAHPDDLEYGAASAVAHWTAQGKKIVYCLVTNGEAGIDGIAPEKARVIREDEQRASAEKVGVEVVDFLGFPDGILEYGLPLRRAIAREIRVHRPQVVLTNNIRDSWDAAQFGMDGSPVNHADHIVTGRAILDGARDAGNRWVFPELLEEGLEPWGDARRIWSANSPQPTHGVDVTDSLDRGVASLRAHAAYIEGLGDPNFDAAEFLETIGRNAGSKLGCEFAVSFEVLQF